MLPMWWNKDEYIRFLLLFVFDVRLQQNFDERVQQHDLKSDATFMMPYNFHHHQQQSHHHQQQHQQPPSSSQPRQCLDRPTDRLQPSAGHPDDVNPATPAVAADLIDLSRSSRAVASTDGRGRPSAAVHPHRPASSTRGPPTRHPPVIRVIIYIKSDCISDRLIFK